jgi:DNA-binding NarL/FixJ family response regulator
LGFLTGRTCLATQDDHDLDGRIRKALLQLAMTSNGNTAKMDANRGGGSARHYADALLVGWLDPLDAPHQRYLDLYMHETTNEGRAAVIALAEDELDRIRISRGHAGVAETLDDFYDRIVLVGEDWPAAIVAVNVRTSVLIVRRARKERGRDQETGKPVEDSSGLGRQERQRRVRQLASQGRNAREIAHALGIPYNTVRRDLGKKA